MLNLVIVESPAKAKTIKQFLGDNFEVMSSYGHIRDLPLKSLGINIEKNFEPLYEVSSDKKNIVKNLNSYVQKADFMLSVPFYSSPENRLFRSCPTISTPALNPSCLNFHRARLLALV